MAHCRAQSKQAVVHSLFQLVEAEVALQLQMDDVAIEVAELVEKAGCEIRQVRHRSFHVNSSHLTYEYADLQLSQPPSHLSRHPLVSLIQSACKGS